jgi:eukaryotic-like serine/threonine-protein kinase
MIALHDRDPCGAIRSTSAWSPAIVARVAAATAPWGERAVAGLDATVARWDASHREVCEATRRGDQSERWLELRMRCLDRALDRIGALASVLGEPLDAPARANAIGAIAELPDPVACEHADDAGDTLPAEPAARERVLAAERRLDRGWALFGLGRYREARSALGEIVSEPVGVRAASLALDGAIEARTGAAASARERLQQALLAAAAAHAPELELEIWARLLRTELFGGNPQAVIEQAPFARAAAARAGRAGAELDGIVGEARRDAGQLDEARTILRRALASHDPLRGDQRAVIEMNLGSVELAAGNPSAAEAAFVHAEAAARALLGDGHPELALYADKRAAAETARGEIRAALAHHAASLEVRERTFGPSDRSVATSLFHRAQTLIEGGQLTLARADLERARAIRAQAFGATSPRLGELEAALGDAEAAAGHAEAARAHFDRAASLDPRVELAARRLALGDAVTDVPDRLLERALQLVAAPDRAQAIALYDRWRAAPAPVDARLSCAVAAALAAVHDPDAERVYLAALAALADEPSLTRLRALTGLHRDTTAIRTAMPEVH